MLKFEILIAVTAARYCKFQRGITAGNLCTLQTSNLQGMLGYKKKKGCFFSTVR